MATLSGYPTLLPNNAKVFNFIPANIYPFNANFDIVWSFEFNLCGSNVASQGGFTAFLLNVPPTVINNVSTPTPLPPVGSVPYLTGGNVGIDLGYSGLSAGNYTSGYTSTGKLSSTTINGILSTIIGIGFDTTGLFALSAKYDSGTGNVYTRDGVALPQVISKSLIVRGGYPNYPLLSTQQLPSRFTLLDNTGSVFTALRFRLGNIGKTLYVDYKTTSDVNYQNLLVLPVDLTIQDGTAFTVGVSYTSPISTADSSLTTNLRIRNFHIEGRTDPVPYTYGIASNTSNVSFNNLITDYFVLTGTDPNYQTPYLDILLEEHKLETTEIIYPTGTTINGELTGTTILI
ncbi:MAG: hypothetical protein EBU90_30850 [Proteobacteria bacterium]|nr:hypothetical protein [Pseudomonadota bacterium]